MIRKGNRNKRIAMIKKIKEEYELSKAKRAIDVKGEKALAIQKETKRTDRQLKKVRR